MADNPYVVNPRWAIADEIGAAVRRRHTDAVLAIGVYGPLAHGDDTQSSDVGLVVVTHRPETGPSPCARRVGDVIVDLGVIDAPKYLANARTLSTSWPLAADQYVTTRPLYDPRGWFEQLRNTHLSRLADATAGEFSALAREAWCRAVSAHRMAVGLAEWYDTDGALVALGEARLATAIVAGLLTRTYFRDSTDAVRRTGVAGADPTELAGVLAAQAHELARRGRPVDATVSDLLD